MRGWGIVLALGLCACAMEVESDPADDEPMEPQRASWTAGKVTTHPAVSCWLDLDGGGQRCDSWTHPYRFVCSEVPYGCFVDSTQPLTPAVAVCCVSQCEPNTKLGAPVCN